MIKYRIADRPGFDVVGRKTWISGPDNDLFGRFWQQCRAKGLFELFQQINQLRPGPVTGGVTLGVSCVEKDPTIREFYYLIAIEKPEGYMPTDLDIVHLPPGTWAIFECLGKPPESIVKAEMFAFMDWLPQSGYIHANAPEMEVYLPEGNRPGEDSISEFWLPIKGA